MKIKDILEEKKISIYQASHLSGVPYSTISDLCHEKTDIRKVNAQTLYQLAHFFNMSSDELFEKLIIKPFSAEDFEIFKSNVCHKLKKLGDFEFIKDNINNDYVSMYWNLNMYPEAFYYLALVDYLSDKNDIPIWNKYREYRKQKLRNPVFPLWITINEMTEEEAKKELQDVMPEFLKYNIYEGMIYDAY